jgi:hypothetical protein
LLQDLAQQSSVRLVFRVLRVDLPEISVIQWLPVRFLEDDWAADWCEQVSSATKQGLNETSHYFSITRKNNVSDLALVSRHEVDVRLTLWNVDLASLLVLLIEALPFLERQVTLLLVPDDIHLVGIQVLRITKKRANTQVLSDELPHCLRRVPAIARARLLRTTSGLALR